MELLIMAYACKTSSARSIVGVIPYLPYSKQCKMRKRGCIVSKLLAKVNMSVSVADLWDLMQNLRSECSQTLGAFGCTKVVHATWNDGFPCIFRTTFHSFVNLSSLLVVDGVKRNSSRRQFFLVFAAFATW